MITVNAGIFIHSYRHFDRDQCPVRSMANASDCRFFPQRPDRSIDRQKYRLRKSCAAEHPSDTNSRCGHDLRRHHRLHGYDAAILFHDRAEQHLGFPPQRPSQGIIKIRKEFEVRSHLSKVAKIEPLCREVAAEAIRLLILQHAFNLRLKNSGGEQTFVFAQLKQFVVRHSVPNRSRRQRPAFFWNADSLPHALVFAIYQETLTTPRFLAIVSGNRPSDEANVVGPSTQPSHELVEVLCDRKTVADLKCRAPRTLKSLRS